MSIIRGNRLFFALGGGGGDGDMKKSVYDPNGYVEENGGIPDYVDGAISGKQDVLTFDSTPTYGSSNPVTSDGIRNALDSSKEQSDWNTSNSSLASYIKNRPIYDERRDGEQYYSGSFTGNSSYIIKNTSSEDQKNYYTTSFSHGMSDYLCYRATPSYLNVGEEYIVVIGGIKHYGVAQNAVITDCGESVGSRICVEIPNVCIIYQDRPAYQYQYYALRFGYAETFSVSVEIYSVYGLLKTLETKYAPWAELANNRVNLVDSNSDNKHYPSAKAVYDFVTGQSGGSSVVLRTTTVGTSWSGTDPYTQTITIPGATITEHSKVDIQPDLACMEQLSLDGVSALWIENNNGTLTANAIGGHNTVALTIQCTITEVS